MKRTLLKLLAVLVLTPVIGFGLTFGAAFAYGRIAHGMQKSIAAEVLEQRRPELERFTAEHGMLQRYREWQPPEELRDDVKGIEYDDGIWLFRTQKQLMIFGEWVPCGLMYAEDLSRNDRWRRCEPLAENWYFYWETN